MKLTADNYFTPEANRSYWSVSQFKEFQKCEAAAMAAIRGEHERSMTPALLQGSFVDAHFSGSMNEFLDEHPEVLNKRTGALKADFSKAITAIDRAESDPMFMKYMSGAPQAIMTGEIFGKPWKIKVDSLHGDKIVDLKYMRSTDKVYKDGEYKTFIDAYGYDIQGFVYQKVVQEHFGSTLPFYLAVITKEDAPNIEIIHIPDWKLRSAGEMVKYWVEKYDEVKRGERLPERCDACEYCRATKKLTRPIEYEELAEELLK